MSKVEKQQTNVENLFQLIKENPTLRIVPMVDSEIVASDEFGWWIASWGKASVEEIYTDDERVYIRSLDEDELIEKVADQLSWIEELSDEEAGEKAENEVKNYSWEKVITVKITV